MSAGRDEIMKGVIHRNDLSGQGERIVLAGRSYLAQRGYGKNSSGWKGPRTKAAKEQAVLDGLFLKLGGGRTALEPGMNTILSEGMPGGEKSDSQEGPERRNGGRHARSWE